MVNSEFVYLPAMVDVAVISVDEEAPFSSASKLETEKDLLADDLLLTS